MLGKSLSMQKIRNLLPPQFINSESLNNDKTPKEVQEKMSNEDGIPVTEGKKQVADGLHTGEIVSYEFKEIPHPKNVGETLPYVDIFTSLTDQDSEGSYVYEYEADDGSPQLQTVKIGVSRKITPNSNLGKILTQLGYTLSEYTGQDFPMKEELIGLKLQFQTTQVTKTNKEGVEQTFGEVIQGSIKKA